MTLLERIVANIAVPNAPAKFLVNASTEDATPTSWIGTVPTAACVSGPNPIPIPNPDHDAHLPIHLDLNPCEGIKIEIRIMSGRKIGIKTKSPKVLRRLLASRNGWKSSLTPRAMGVNIGQLSTMYVCSAK